MDCPYCGFHFGAMLASEAVEKLPPVTPVWCENCDRIGVLMEGPVIRTLTTGQEAEVMSSPAGEFIREAQKARKKVIAQFGHPAIDRHTGKPYPTARKQ